MAVLHPQQPSMNTSQAGNLRLIDGRFVTQWRLRALVLDYLCHHRYITTGQAFARDSAVRNLKLDGNKITLCGTGDSKDDDASDLTADMFRQAELRDQIRVQLLSGHVEAAMALLEAHFPHVLSESVPAETTPPTKRRVLPDEVEYIAPTSVEPVHLNLNLHILAFIEASRTIPLPYTSTPPTAPVSLGCSEDKDDNADSAAEHLGGLLSRVRKLYALLEMLQNEADRQTYITELSQVRGLLAYKVPEESPLAPYLSQARRGAVADQIDCAILHWAGLPPISYLELYTRYASAVWNALGDIGVKVSSVGDPPLGVFPILSCHRDASEADAKKPHDTDAEYIPQFDLTRFLDTKT